MKYNKNNIVIIGAVLVLMVAGYFYLTRYSNTVSGKGDIMIGGDEINKTAAVLQSGIDTYFKDREDRITRLVRRDLYENVVIGTEEYGIADGTLRVDTAQLISTAEWNIFSLGDNGLVFKYPASDSVEGMLWQTVEGEEGSGSKFIMTATLSGEVLGGTRARIIIGEYERDFGQSIFDWMRLTGESSNGIVPFDRTTQYVTIGESTFLGSIFFKENIWVGRKNAYAEVTSGHIFVATIEVENMKPDSEMLGRFDQVFYTILESLEIK